MAYFLPLFFCIWKCLVLFLHLLMSFFSSFFYQGKIFCYFLFCIILILSELVSFRLYQVAIHADFSTGS